MVSKCVAIVSINKPTTEEISRALNSGGKSYRRTRTCINVNSHAVVIINLKKTACLSRNKRGLNRNDGSSFHCPKTIINVIRLPIIAIRCSQTDIPFFNHLFRSNSAKRKRQKNEPRKISGPIPDRLCRICISCSLISN